MKQLKYNLEENVDIFRDSSYRTKSENDLFCCRLTRWLFNTKLDKWLLIFFFQAVQQITKEVL